MRIVRTLKNARVMFWEDTNGKDCYMLFEKEKTENGYQYYGIGAYPLNITHLTINEYVDMDLHTEEFNVIKLTKGDVTVNNGKLEYTGSVVLYKE